VQLSYTAPSPSSHVNTHSVEGEITHSFPVRARANGYSRSCCVLWIKVGKDNRQCTIHQLNDLYLRMVGLVVPHAEVYRPP